MNKKEKTKENKKRPVRITWGERLNSYFCPLLLGASACFSMIYVLHKPFALPYTLLFLIEELLLFLFFDRLKSMPVTGGLIYTFILLVVVWFSVRLVFIGIYSGHANPLSWFYGEEGIDGNQPYYFAALALGGAYFLTSILYYFTQVRYRSLGMMLCTLFPFVFYAKRGDEMPAILITLIITCFLAVMIHNRRIDPAKDKALLGKMKVDLAYIMSFAVFISVTGAVAMSIKKPTYRSRLEKNADFFDTLLLNGAGVIGYENLSMNSSTRNGGFSYNNTPLFYFETDSNRGIHYLRRQVFDRFEGDTWKGTQTMWWRLAPYSQEAPEYTVKRMMDDLAVAAPLMLMPAPPEAEKLYTVRNARVFDKDFSPTFLPAPYATITDDKQLYQTKYSKYGPSSVIYRIKTWGEKPTALNDRYQFYEVNGDLYNYAKELGLTGREYIENLSHWDNIELFQRLEDDYLSAVENYSDDTGVSNRLRELSYKITDDCKSDLEKAEALEAYFTKNGYLYSTEYVPKDKSIDYFVFESKTGYCAGYATAMTLMARSIGLPARYVEGFAAFEPTDDGSIIVREGHAHAFVEVYIPGAGWLTFDPTVSDYRSMSGGGNINTDILFYILFLLSRFFIVIIVGSFIVFFVLFDRIKEFFFRILLKFKPVKKRGLMLYANLIKLVNFSSKQDYSSFTVKMLRIYLKKTRGTVPEKLLDLFEKTAFGGYEPSESEYLDAYSEYKKCYKYLRRIPKEKELNKILTQQAQ